MAKTIIKKRVVIIGAGPAGLATAYELLKNSGYKKFDVTILEASDQVGGIARTIKHCGQRFDLGPHRFFSKNERVQRWWEEILPHQGSPSADDLLLKRRLQLKTGGPNPERENKVMLFRSRITRIIFQQKLFDYPLAINWKTIKNLGLKNTFYSTVSFFIAKFNHCQPRNLEEFYIQRFGKHLYQIFFEGYTQKLWGKHPRDISADWGCQRVKSLSILVALQQACQHLLPAKNKKAVEASLIDHYLYPKYGSGQLWEEVAEKIKMWGGKIIFNAEVKTITATSKSRIKQVEYYDRNQRHIINGDYFVSSMPLKNLITSLSPAVPNSIRSLANKLPFRDLVIVYFLIPKLKLNSSTNNNHFPNSIPDSWLYIQNESVKLNRISIFNNFSPYLVDDPQNAIGIGLEFACYENDELWNASDAKMYILAAKELLQLGIIDDDIKIKISHRLNVAKAYPAYFDSYQQIDQLIAYTDCFSNLVCVGRNGQHRYNNMDHSVATGMMAADWLKHKPGINKTMVWQINADADYHETKLK